jgi:15-cis-phytoene synthase
MPTPVSGGGALAVDLAAGSPLVIPALPGVDKSELTAAYEECAALTRTRARNFYYGLRLTPEPRRSALYSIYAWMRHADDCVDTSGTVEHRRSALWRYRAMTDMVLSGEMPDEDPARFWLAFAATVRSYPIDPAIVRDMLSGLEEDLDHEWYRTEEDLWRYCYHVASTVGLACVAIWGTRAAADATQVRDLAIRRGQAFQRTNILRDFAEDFDSQPRRVYLPREAFERAGLTPEELRNWSKPSACEGFIRDQAARARAEYAASQSLESMVDPACAPTLWAMTQIYSGILGRIEQQPERIVRARIRLASAKKAWIALSATLKGRSGKW